MNIIIENTKQEEHHQLEKIIEEVYQAEDKSVDFVANDMLKQSSELQMRLAERRRKAKMGGENSFFRRNLFIGFLFKIISRSVDLNYSDKQLQKRKLEVLLQERDQHHLR